MIKRFEAEAMNREQIEALSITSLEHNGFTTFIFEDDNGTFKELNAMTFYGSRKIDYVTYPDYVNRIKGLEAYKAYVKKQQEIKLLSFEDLSSVSNYDDYRKKIDFIYNIMPQLYDSQSIFDSGVNKGYKFKFFTRYYRFMQDGETVRKYRDALEELYQEMMKDSEKLYQALVHEFYNHETPIDWDGWEPALNALGLSEKTLTPEQLKIASKAYNYVCSHGTW